MNGQTSLLERTMADLAKSDCISVQKVLEETGVVKNTLNSYMNTLSIQRHRFPFDRRLYITLADFERIKQFIEEIRRD